MDEKDEALDILFGENRKFEDLKEKIDYENLPKVLKDNLIDGNPEKQKIKEITKTSDAIFDEIVKEDEAISSYNSERLVDKQPIAKNEIEKSITSCEDLKIEENISSTNFFDENSHI